MKWQTHLSCYYMSSINVPYSAFSIFDTYKQRVHRRCCIKYDTFKAYIVATSVMWSIKDYTLKVKNFWTIFYFCNCLSIFFFLNSIWFIIYEAMLIFIFQSILIFGLIVSTAREQSKHHWIIHLTLTLTPLFLSFLQERMNMKR